MTKTGSLAIALGLALGLGACTLNVSVPSRMDLFVHESPTGLVCGYVCAMPTERSKDFACTPMKENPAECSEQKFSPAVSEMSRLPGKYTP